MSVYTLAAYVGSSIYTASTPGIIQEFYVSKTIASLGLALYVFAYGIAPMILSPLSEIPAIGRDTPYVVTFVLFTLLSISIPLIDSIAGILLLRFLLGFFCSPAIATAGASCGDIFSPERLQYAIALWGGFAMLTPSLGPLVAGFAVQAEDWRWSGWELLWLSAQVVVLMVFALPETSSDTILLRRARRLRALTGREDLKSEPEVRQSEMKAGTVAFDAFDLAILFTTTYLALIYGIYYSFFESFPLAFQGIYGFDLDSPGMAFLCVLVGLVVVVVFLLAYIRYIAPRRFVKYDTVTPEERMWPAFIATFFIPTGLFIFAWTVRESIHWSVCMVGMAMSECGIFLISQAIFIYLPSTYPRYAGSLFAANGLARSLFAGAAILFSLPMLDALGVDGGVSLLAGLSILCIFGVYGLWFFGANLRKRSRFAVSE
ncbi:major facilitator superfamily domain-containing protein [Hypoxylon crocopeplum]|nr:major facilitator superfamily domain-containing protein [Hypoxylon crocopeplum]